MIVSIKQNVHLPNGLVETEMGFVQAERGDKMPRLKLIEMDSLNKMIYFRKDDKLIAFDADVAIELISDSLDGKCEPVRHGRWILNKPSSYGTHCDCCGWAWSDHIDAIKLNPILSYIKTNYCPNCGADMREVRNE